MRFLRIIGYLLGACVVFSLIVSLLIKLFFPASKIKRLVETQVWQHANREARLGDVRVSWRGLSVSDFQLSDVPGFSAGTCLTVDKMAVRWALSPLVSRQVKIVKMELFNPKIQVTRMKDGESFNLSDLAGGAAGANTPTASAPPASKGRAWRWSIDTIHLANGVILFKDLSPAGQSSTLSDIDLLLTDFDPTRVNWTLTIGRIQNSVYNASDASLQGSLQGIDPTLRQLNGSMRLKQGPGQVRNLSRLADSSRGARIALLPLVMLQNLDRIGFVRLGLPDFSQLDIDHIAGDYSFERGVMKINTLDIVGPHVTVQAGGTVNLVDGQLGVDVLLRTPQRMDVKLKITGTLSNPKTNLDSLKQKMFKATLNEVLKNPNSIKDVEKNLKNIFK